MVFYTFQIRVKEDLSVVRNDFKFSRITWSHNGLKNVSFASGHDCSSAKCSEKKKGIYTILVSIYQCIHLYTPDAIRQCDAIFRRLMTWPTLILVIYLNRMQKRLLITTSLVYIFFENFFHTRSPKNCVALLNRFRCVETLTKIFNLSL